MDYVQIVTKYIIKEFLPDVSESDLDPDYDLLQDGVLDSLVLLKIIDWIGERFDVDVDEVDLEPESFQTVSAIAALIETMVGTSSAVTAGHEFAAPAKQLYKVDQHREHEGRPQ